MRGWIAMAVLLPNFAAAEPWPEGTRVFIAETASTSFPHGFSSQEQTRVVVEPDQDGLRSYSDCDYAYNHCNRRTVEGLFRTHGMDSGQPDALLDPSREPGIEVTLSGVGDRSIFPLQDGAVHTWVESYRGASFAGTYDLTLTVRCCVTSLSPLATSDDLWELTLTWSQQDGGRENGQNILIYDEDLGWWVESFTRTSGPYGEDGYASHLRKQLLISEE